MCHPLPKNLMGARMLFEDLILRLILVLVAAQAAHSFTEEGTFHCVCLRIMVLCKHISSLGWHM